MRTAKEHEESMFNFIKEICRQIGPRPACSKEEEKCAHFLLNKLNNFSDEAYIDDFYCRPGAYPASFHWPILLYIFSIPVYFFIPWISVILTIFALIILFGNMSQNKEIIDPLFKKQKSSNVIAKIKPKKECKNIIILSGHHDSNVEFPLGKKYGSKINIFMTLPIFFNFFLLILSVIRMIISFSSLLNIVILGFLIATIPVFVFLYIKIISNTPVMGANDNLSALAICFSIAQYFSLPKNKLSHSELWIVSFGCEEIGIRGSKRFVSKYFKDIKDAYNINLDLVGETGCQLYINSNEEMGTLKLSPEICNILERAGRKINIPIKRGGILSFTDSMSFAKKKLKSAGIIALRPDGDMPRFYHSTDDTIEIIDPKLMRKCLEICLQAIYDIDSKFS